MTCHRRILDGRRDLLAPAAAFPGRYPCLLESVVHGSAQSRYDILFAFPREQLSLHADGRLHDGAGNAREGRFLDALDEAWQAERLLPVDDELPFHGGWVLLLAYELAGEIEPTLNLQPPPTLPLALAVRCPAAVIVDHLRDCTILVAESGHEDLLDALATDLAAASPISPLAAPIGWDEDAPRQFLDGVARIHEHLHAGDIFQVNLSRAWRARHAQPPAPASLYAVLRQANPAPFAGLLQQPDWAVVSSSPERLVEVRGGVAQTRPIAGTRPRLPGDDELARIRELSAHPKERAEHVMLIDLERNDLGRICVPGTVKVDELMAVESLRPRAPHRLQCTRAPARRRDARRSDCAPRSRAAPSPAAPRCAAWKSSPTLEDSPRGAYTGALGYLDRNGELDLNILIRTLTVTGNEVSLRAGAGIVADSVAAGELDETRAKARGLLRALGVPD